MKATSTDGVVEIPMAEIHRYGRDLLRVSRKRIKDFSRGNDEQSMSQWKVVKSSNSLNLSIDGVNLSGSKYRSDVVHLSECEQLNHGNFPYTIGKNILHCLQIRLIYLSPKGILLRNSMITDNCSKSADACLSACFIKKFHRPPKFKGVKCSECDNTEYSRQLLLRHMAQIHGIVAPLIYKSFSDRRNLQLWLEQLRETHAIEFVMSSGSKKWGRGVQVHYLICSRSGEQKGRPNRKFQRLIRPSIKCGKNCMAYLKMKQNPTCSKLEIEACLHHSGHEIDASKICLERNEWCRVLKVIREIDEGSLQIDPWHISRIREVLGSNGRFRLMTDEGICQQLPKWIQQYSSQKLRMSPAIREEVQSIEDSAATGHNAHMLLKLTDSSFFHNCVEFYQQLHSVKVL
ncbi:hypothetical protein DICVIV_09329 [Dictyocaulus viviparus]|uniref:C2H2-type domain-containing protein n=1 Tax=Dictyocaulus viviparus TaxID=29172 RepID=A0A0D8XQJ4_DICVI|nr:hypothetical protein DICVIV_09329 [Dictyocaulus viviparus]